MLRQLQAARRLGGLAAALPRAAEPVEALRAVCGPAALHVAATNAALWGEGCSRGAATLPLGVARGFAAAAGGDDESAEPAAPVAAPQTGEGAATRGDADDKMAVPAAGAAPVAARAKRARHSGVHGEKTASGRPKPDVRTVARLLQLGWWVTPEEAEVRLTRGKGPERYAYETAGPAIDWLLETLGEGEHRSGRSRAAHAVFQWPHILTRSTSALQAGWEMVVHSREAGGLGLSLEVAQKRVASYPPVLGFSKEFMVKRAAFLEMLGVPDGRAAIAGFFRLLGNEEDTLRRGAECLRSQGLDVVRMLSARPDLLWRSPEGLSPKLDFMRVVVGLSTSAIDSRFLTGSLESLMRPRYFYSLQRGVEQRYTFGSLVKCSDVVFLRRAHSLPRGTHATAEDVAAYQAHIASPAFRAYMDEQEAAIRARGPQRTT